MYFLKKFQNVLVVLSVLVVLTSSATKVVAEDGWNSSVGAGVYMSNVYIGSDDYYFSPIPLAQTSYSKNDFSFSLSLLDGLGVLYSDQKSGFHIGAFMTYGDERDSQKYSVLGISRDHSDKTKRFLQDSPTASTSFSSSVVLGFDTKIGTFEASISYNPTTVDYDQSGLDDKDYQGFLYSLSYSIEHPVTEQLIVAAKLGVDFMNQDYADAWYSVDYQTKQLDTFDAEAGLRDAIVSLQVTKMFSDRIGMSLRGEGMILLMDASKSPYTAERFQSTVMLCTFYNF
jgi:outer membrane scaffolding protein for murein synthesis (MipA/OmpV family)